MIELPPQFIGRLQMAGKPKFSVGDLVALKSGSPVMTIELIEYDYRDQWTGRYRCSWFAGSKHNQETFSEAVLETTEL
jgi:uncharacterized protein YodC (DUF2158 family)